jgi:hypothetical protein
MALYDPATGTGGWDASVLKAGIWTDTIYESRASGSAAWRIVTVNNGGTNTVIQNFDIDRVSKGSKTTALDLGTSVVMDEFGCRYVNAANTLEVDWIFIRQFLATEPAWGAWGIEESTLQNYSLPLEAASFAMTGQVAKLAFVGSIKTAPTAFEFSGTPLKVLLGHTPFILDAGAIAMVGVSAALRMAGAKFIASPGAFIMSGMDVDLFHHWYGSMADLSFQFKKRRMKFSEGN